MSDPAAGRIGPAAALLVLVAGTAAGGCGGAEPSRGGTSALSRSPAHADGTELDRPPGIEPPAGREPEAEADAAQEEAPASSARAAGTEASGGPRVVPFAALQSQQISGPRTIQPSRRDAEAMAASGKAVLGVVTLCLDDKGAPTEVTPVRSTGYPDYDARIRSGVEAWRFRPQLVDGNPVAVCSSVTITFRPDRPPPAPPSRKQREAQDGD